MATTNEMLNEKKNKINKITRNIYKWNVWDDDEEAKKENPQKMSI